MKLAIGTRLGPYDVLTLLGAGGMGKVYRAHDSRLARTVAIKVLPHDIITSLQARERFQLEARAVAGLQHPNICRPPSTCLTVGRSSSRIRAYAV